MLKVVPTQLSEREHRSMQFEMVWGSPVSTAWRLDKISEVISNVVPIRNWLQLTANVTSTEEVTTCPLNWGLKIQLA